MIINLIDNINDVLKDNGNKYNSIEKIKKEIESGMNVLYKNNDEVIYRVRENIYINIYPLYEFGNISDETYIRKTKDFNIINKFNSLKQESDEIIKELKAVMNDETIELLNRYIEISENKPLFAITMSEGDTFKPKVLRKNTGIYFNNIYKLLISYLDYLGVTIEEINEN
jgi:hypothetical protein